MTKVEQLERDVQNLTPEELTAFRNWFAEYDWARWDRQLEADVAAGKLDALAAEALAEDARGETTPIPTIRHCTSNASGSTGPSGSASRIER